jgi:hypothetical protein
MTIAILSPSQIITLMLLSGWMIAWACSFGHIIWLDVILDVITWLGDTFPAHFVLSSGWMII